MSEQFLYNLRTFEVNLVRKDTVYSTHDSIGVSTELFMYLLYFQGGSRAKLNQPCGTATFAQVNFTINNRKHQQKKIGHI